MKFRHQAYQFVSAVILVCVLLPTATRAQFTQQGPKLVGTGVVGTDAGQGFSVSLSGDGNTAILGGPFDDGDAGAAWVFTRCADAQKGRSKCRQRSRGEWTQQIKLVGTGAVNTPGPAAQGHSVSLSGDGNTAIVSGPFDNGGAGAAWVFTRSGGVWAQQGPKLVGTGAVGTPAVQGFSVALSSDGNTAILGGPYDDFDAGAAWVFTRSGGVWTQQGPKLVGAGAVSAPFSQVFQGFSVALSGDGNTAIVGGPSDNDDTGAAWVFTRSGGVWTQQGPKLVGTGVVGIADQGNSVALSGDGNTAILGGPVDSNGIGAAWVFTRSGEVWTQQGPKLVGAGAIPAPNGVFQGSSVSLSGDGDTAILGGPLDNGTTGAAWVFERCADAQKGRSKCRQRSGRVWTQQGPKLVGTGAVGSAEQGGSVALSGDGNTAILGGLLDNHDTGAAWVFAQPVFAGTPGKANCIGQSVSPLAQQYGGLNNAAAELGFDSVKALQAAIGDFCEA
jgi:hypothetical protein